MRVCWWIALVLGVFLTCAGCKPRGTSGGTSGGERAVDTIQIKGSDTMVNLNQALAEAFMGTTSTIRVSVTGGGSGTGIAAMIQGTTDIAASSRQMKAGEIADATKAGHAPKEYIVGLDGIAVIVNPKNPVKSLSLDQLADMYTGKVTDWKQVGGTSGPIVLLGREVNSGTHVFFKEHVVQRGNAKSASDYAKSMRLLSSSSALVTEVAQNVRTISYVGLGYVTPDIRVVPIAKKAGAKPVMPSEVSVRGNTYPVSRPLYLYTNGEPTGAVKTFLDFVLSADGQAVVREQDFVPIQ
jgi:phosphate transport system substrate-binding protein